MADEKQLIDIEALSHFKAKQDIYNAKKFKSKDDATDLKGAVRYDTAQVLTAEEKAQARANLGITENGGGGGGDGGTAEGAVRYDVQQALGDDDKARARANIGTTDGTWANMPDKPFGETGVKIEWDGTPTDVSFDELKDILSLIFYKVGEPITKENLIGSTVTLIYNGELITSVVTADMLVDLSADSFIVMYDGYAPMFYVSLDATVSDLTVIDPSLGSFEVYTGGVWFLSAIDGNSRTCSIETGDYSCKTIDKKYIPNATDVAVTPMLSLQRIDDNSAYLYDMISFLSYMQSGGGDESEAYKKICVNIPSEQFIVPFSLFNSGSFDTTKDYTVTIITQANSAEDMTGIKVNLGKLPGEIKLSIVYQLYVRKRSDGTYKGDFISFPSSYIKLDENGLIPASMLPSYVDDVIEGYFNEEDSLFYKTYDFTVPIQGESGKIYIDKNSSISYRFGGTIFGVINPPTYTLATNADIEALFS